MKQLLYALPFILFLIAGKNVSSQPTLFADPSASYCTGSSGVTLGINNTNAGNNYTLQKQSGTWTNITTINSPSGGTIFFPGNFTAGNYRLTVPPQTVLTISATPLPETVYNITLSVASGGTLTTDGAGFCNGSTSYPTIGLSGSQIASSGVIYKLYKDGTWYNSLQLTGNGSALSFGQISDPGVYTIRAERNGCQRNMNGSKTISVFPLPNVSFTPNYLSPPNGCGTVDFTPVITYSPPGSGSPYNYSWDFGTGSNPQTSTQSNPSCQFPAYGTGTQSFPVSLLVTDKNGCQGTYTNSVSVTQRPDALLEATPFWNNCSNSSTFTITIINKSTTASTNTSYTIDWDDPNDPVNLTLTPIQFPFDGTRTHTYTSTGTFHLTITAVGPGPNNCIDTREFPVFNGSTPTGGITYNAGILQGCKPHTITFYLSGDAQNNAPTTNYFFDFGDGTPPLTFTQETMPTLFPDGKYHIDHTYTTSSCSAPGNSFTLTHYIENPCSTVPNNVGGIKISEKSVSDFLRNEFPDDPIYVCAGVPKTYTNNTIVGCIIYAGNVYNNTNYYWDFFNDGSVETTDESPVFTFPDPGTYEVKLTSVTGEAIPNNCGDSIVIREVCVQGPPLADFVFTDPLPYCINTPYTPINNSTFEPACSLPEYVWTVSPSSGYSFESGSNANSFEPTFSFSVPGVYTIQLAVNIYSGSTICNTSIYQQVITILGPPTVTVIQSNIDLCGPGDVDLSSAISYNANGGSISNYQWTINPTGPNITLDTDPFPIVSVIDDITQVYTLTVVTDNECGSSTPVQITISVTQTLDNNSISYAGNTNLCSGMSLSDDIIGSLPSGGTNTYTYQWYIQESSGWVLLPGSTPSLDYNTPLTVNPTSFKRVVVSGSCEIESNIIDISLYPGIQNNSILSPQSICLGDPISPITGSNPTQGNGSYSYLWQESTNSPLFDIWTSASPPNDQLGYIPVGISQTTRFRRIVYSGLCNSTSNEIEITVYPTPVINSPASSTVCSGDGLNYSITSTAAGSSYQWTVTDLSGGVVTGWNNYPGGSLTVIPDVLVNTSSIPQTIQYIITPIGPAPTQCTGSSFTLTVTVRPAFSSTYTDKSINVGTSTIINGVLTGGTSGYTYSWSPVSMLASPAQASLANPLTTILYANQSYTLTATDGAGCQFIQSVLVSTGGVLLQVGLIADDADQTICQGNPITITASASGGAGNGIPSNYLYTWTGIPVGATYLQPWSVQFIPASTGLNTYSVEVGDTYTTADANISITVNANPSVTSPLSQQICSGENINYTPTSDVAGTTFTWLRNTNACITPLPGANSGNNSISNILTNNCNTIQSISYTITPTGPAPTFCPGTPQTLVVDVMPVASITTTPNNQTVNSGFPTSAVTLSSDVAAANFHWQFYSVDCPSFFGSYLPGGNTSTLPVQTFTILPGGPSSCEICYEANAYVTLANGTECEGPPFYYCYTVNLEPAKYNLECPTPVCEGGSASITLEYSDIGIEYQLYQDGNPYDIPQPGCDCPIVWSGITMGGNYMVIATNTSNGVSVPMNNDCDVIFYPNPISNYLISSTTNCPGATIALNWCESDVSYQLWRNGIIPVGSPLIGLTPPAPLNFGPVTDPGIYTIVATASYPGTTCEAQINGNVIINANPQEFLFNPSGPQCAGDAFGLIDSEAGFFYELWCTPLATGSPIYIGTFTGTGLPIDFGIQTVPGTYFIHAINPFTGCDIYFTDTKVLWPNPEPYNISPQGPNNCGLTTIGLDDSQVGFTYEVRLLDINGIPFPTPSPNFTIQNGTGSALVFGTSDAPGTYVIIAFDQNNICSTQMYGSVTILPEPTQYWIYPTGNIYCVDQAIGTEIFLEDSEIGVDYTLSNGGSVLITLAGTGNQLSFGFQNQPGTYSITALNPANTCTSDMLGDVTISLRPQVYTMNPVNDICPGDEEIWLSSSQTGVIYTLNTPGGPIPLPGTGDPLYWGYFHTPGTYTIEATLTTIPDCPTLMDGDVVIHPNPGIFDVLHQGINCISTTIGLSGSELNTTYELIYEDGSSLTPPEIYIPAVAGPFWFATPQPVGNYTVKATNSFGCDTLMNGVVIIDLGPAVDAGPADLTICNTPPFSVDLTGSAANYSTVNWTSSSSGTFSDPNNLITTYILAPEDISSQMVVLTLTAFGTGGCLGTQVTDQITIHILSPFADAGPDQVICEGESVMLDGTINGGTTTGLWSSSGDGAFLPDPATIDAEYIPGVADISSGSVTLTLTTTNATPCPDISDEILVTINPIPDVTDPADQVLCDGSSSLPVTFISTVPGTVFSWTNDLPSIGLAANGNGDIPAFTAVNNGSSPVIANITVTPAFTFGGVSCTGSPQTFTITVNPNGQVNDPADQVVCNGDMTNPVVFSTTNTVGTTTYNWTNDLPSIGLAASGTGDITAFAAINSGTSPVTATITVTPTFSNGGEDCTGTAQTFTITVNPNGQVNDPADQVVCNGDLTDPIVFSTNNTVGTTTYNWTIDLPAIGLAASGTGDIAAFAAINTGTVPVVATITVTPTFSYGGEDCTGTAQTITITVNPNGQVNDLADQVVCNGDLTAPVAFTTNNTLGTTTYDWTNDLPSIGLAASGTGDITAFAAINSGTSPVTATITVTPTFSNGGEDCTGTAQTFTITVNPNGQVNDPADQVVCNGDLTDPVTFSTNNTLGTTTYNWTNDLPAIGLAASGTGDITAFAAVNSGTSPVSATITVTPTFTNGGEDCLGTAQTFTITVNPNGQVNDPADQVVCNGDLTAPVAFTTNNTLGTTTYNWTNDLPSIGLAASGTGDITAFAAINSGTSPVTATITITPTFSNGGEDCLGSTQTFTITVNPNGQVNDPADQVVCNGDMTNPVVFTTTNTVGTTTYNWTNDLPSIGLAASGTGDITAFAAVNSGTSPVTATITVTPTFSNGGEDCTGTAQTFTITVNPNGQVNDPADQVVCNGDLTDLITFTTNNTLGTTTYDWTNDLPSIGLAASGTGDIAAFAAINSGTSPVTATITVTPTFSNGGENCLGTAQTFTITVNPNGQINDPADQVVCNGDMTNPVAFTTTNTIGTTTYNWTNDLPSIGLAASGTGDITAFAAVNSGTSPVTATITVTPTFSNGGEDCLGTAQTFTITVNPNGQVNDPADQVLCNGDMTDPVVFSTINTVGTTTYNWTNDLPSIGLAASGTGDISAFASINTGTAPVVATITVTPTFSNGGEDCTGTAQTFTITVNPNGQVNDPADQVVCNGDMTNPVNFTSNNTIGITSYIWTNDLPSIGLAANGTGDIAAFAALNNGTAPVTATITVTPTFSNGGEDCTGAAQTFTITVNPNGQINDPADQVVCNGDLTDPVTFSTNNTLGTTTYNWTNDLPSIGLAAVGTGDITAFTAINSSTTPVTATITVTPTFSNGGEDCTGTAQTFTITVNPKGQVNDPADQVVCNGDMTDPVVFSTINTFGTTTYNWTNDLPSIGLAASGTGDIAAFAAINSGTSPVTATITVIPTFSNGGENCIGTAQTFTITVNPNGQANDPADQVVCNGDLTDPVIFTTNNTVGTTTYNWTNDQVSIGLGSSGTGNIPAFTALNPGTMPVVANITVTPTFSNIGEDCIGTTQTFTITVNPNGQVNDPTDQEVCNGDLTATVVFSTINSSGTTTYNWTNDLPSIGLAASGTGDIPSFNAVNSTTAPVIATITVTPTFTNGGEDCTGTPQTFTIRVNPSGLITNLADQIVCNGALTTAVVFATNNTGGTTTYTWTNDEPGIGLPSSGTGNIPSFTAINNGTTPVVATITVIPTFSSGSFNCPGTPQTFTITVNPPGQVNTPANYVVCNGALTAAVIFSTNNTGGTTIYNWTNNQPSIGLPLSGTGNLPVFLAINNGTSPLVAIITVTPVFSNGGIDCQGTPQTFTITVNPTAQVNDPIDQVVCNGSNTNAVVFGTNNTGGITTYNWTNDNPGIGLAVNGTGDIASFTAVNTGLLPIVATITVTPVYTNGGVGCAGLSQTFTITVNPAGQLIDPADQVVCQGSLTNAVVFSSNNTGGTVTYNWVNSQPGIGLPSSGTGNISAFTAINNGFTPVVATITVTPVFSGGSVSCPGIPQVFTITVNPAGHVTDPVDQVVCNNTLTNSVLLSTNNSGGVTTFNWTNDQPSIGLPASGTGDIPVINATNPGFSPVIATIIITPVFSNGGVSCSGNSETFTITVNPSGNITDPADQVVCNGGLTSSVNFLTNNSGGITTFNWVNNTPSIGLPASGTGDIFAFAAVNTGNTPITASIIVTPTFSNGGVSCNGPSATFTITVNPTGQVNDPVDQTKCHGELTDPVVFTTLNSGGTTTYSWTNSNPAIGLPASGTGNISSFAPTNNGGAIAVAVITVTPHFTNGGITCDGPVQTFSITVFPIFVVGSIENDQSICYNAVPAQLIGTAPTGGNTPYSYQWQYSIDNGTNWYNVTPNGTSLNYQPGALTQTTMYRQVQTSFSGCGSLTTNEIIIEVRIPTAYAGPNDTICGMQPYELAYATANHALQYTWTTSGTGTFTGQYSLIATYFPTPADMANGSVILTLTIEDICGNIVTDHMTLTLGQEPASFFSYSTPTCNNYAIQFMDQSSVSNGYIRTWIWDFGDGTTDTIHFPNNPNISHIFANPGPSFYVKLKVITSLGCSDEFQQVVTLLQAPVANFYFSNIGCENEPVQFTNASQINGSVGLQPFSWNFGDPTTGVSNVSNLENPTHLFSDSGTFIVRLIVVNYNNCLDTIIKEVHIYPAPAVEYTYDISCMNEPVYFSPDSNVMNVNSVSTWLWNFGDGNISHISNVPYIFQSPGNYQVSLTITDTVGCSNEIVHTVVIDPLPIAHFDAGTTNCADSTVHFNELSSSFSAYIVRWEWDFGDGTTAVVLHPNDPNVSHTYALEGSYPVSLRVIQSDSCSNTETQTVIIHPHPVSNFEFVSPACENSPVSFLDLSQSNGGGNIVQWEWNFGDPASGVLNISPLQNPEHDFTSAGQFVVTLTTTTSNGCIDTYFDTVVIKSRPNVDFTYESNCQNSEVQFHPDPVVMNTGAIVSWNWNFGDGGSSTLQSPAHTFTTTGQFIITLTVEDSAGCMNTISKPIQIVPQPYSDFITSQPTCNETAIQFTSLANTTSGYIVRWTWNFGDGTIVTVNNIGNPNVSHTYTNYGTFDVSLTIKTSDSCTQTMVKPIEVSPVPLANFSFTAGCVNQPVTFNDLSQSGTGSLATWYWNFGDPTTGTANFSTQQNPTHVFSTNSASFTVSLMVTNSAGCFDTVYHVVNTTPVPAVDFSYSEGCSNDTTSFTSSTFVNTVTTAEWLWNFGDGNTSAEMDPIHVYAATGTYTVQLTITDNNGCQNIKTHTLIITAPPVAMFQPSAERCAGNSIVFNDLTNPMGGELSTWYWDFGDGTTLMINDPSSPSVEHTYSAPGDFIVTLRVLTLQGCEDDTQQTLTIAPSPLAFFTYTNTCEDTAVSFNGVPGQNGGSAIVGYLWNFGDPASGISNTSTLQNPYHVYINPGLYQVSLIETNAEGCTDSITQPVIIRAQPQVDYLWNSTCLGTETYFTVNTTVTQVPAVALFYWDFGDGTYSNLQDPVHLFSSATTYIVTLTITDTAGCMNSRTYPVSISAKPNALFSYNSGCLNSSVQFDDESFTPNGDPITSWKWDFGVTTATNDTSSLQNPVWVYSTAGFYNVSLIVATAGGCKDTIISTIQVFGVPTAAFQYTAAPCNNGTVYFQDSSYSQQATITSWYWVFEPGQYSTLQDPVYHFTSPDTCHIVMLVVTDMRGCIDTLVKQVCTPTTLSATFAYTPTCELDTTYFSPILLGPAGDSLVSFNWNFGEPSSGVNNTSTLRNPTHLYGSAGTYTVILQTKDKYDCEAQKILFVVVKPLPTANFTYLEGVCDSVIIFNKPSGNSNINQWKWEFGDGTSRNIIGIHPDTIHHKYPDIGTFNAVLTVTNTDNCSSTIQNTVLVKPCLQAAITATSDTVCQYQTSTFTDHSTSGIGITSWMWTFGDGDTLTYSSLQNPITHKYDSAGVFNVRLLVSTQIDGVLVQDSARFTVRVLPAPTAVFAAQNECLGVPVQFYNSSQNNNTLISSWLWQYGDNSPSDTTYHAQHLYMLPGIYNAKLIVENNLGCSDTSMVPIIVHSIPKPDFRISNACLNKLAHFENLTPTEYAMLDSVRWEFNNGNSLIESFETNPNLVFAEKGTYLVNLFVKDVNGCEASIDTSMQIYPGPRSEFSYTEKMDNNEVYLTMTNESRGAQFDTLNYHWDLINTNYSQYIFQSEAENAVFRLPDYPINVNDYYDNDEYYTLRLITTNKYGCMDTLSKDYLYKGLFVPTAIAPENFNSGLRVFQPQGKGLKSYKIEVFDRWGNRLWVSEELQNGMGDIGVGEEYSHPGPGWDGKFNGEFVEIGLYVWKVRAVFKDGSVWQGVNAGEDQNLSGFVYGTVMIVR